jgi:lysine biosynthesis protein LysW
MINPANSNSQNNAVAANCPDCDSELNIPYDVEKGEILSCPGCGLELEVKKLAIGGEGLELKELTIEGEDWGE